MKLEGGCYCKEVRYESTGDAVMKGQCFCRECQYITGGDSVLIMGVPEDGFKVTKGKLKGFKRADLERGVTREFCPNCGTHITTRAMPGLVMIKIGSLDDPSVFGGPEMAIFTCDKQSYHRVPEGIPTFDKMPG
jgi:hypothetical protein